MPAGGSKTRRANSCRTRPALLVDLLGAACHKIADGHTRRKRHQTGLRTIKRATSPSVREPGRGLVLGGMGGNPPTPLGCRPAIGGDRGDVLPGWGRGREALPTSPPNPPGSSSCHLDAVRRKLLLLRQIPSISKHSIFGFVVAVVVSVLHGWGVGAAVARNN